MAPRLALAAEKPHNSHRARADTRETKKQQDGVTQYATRLAILDVYNSIAFIFSWVTISNGTFLLA